MSDSSFSTNPPAGENATAQPVEATPVQSSGAVTSAVDRELANRLREELDGVEQALARLDAGTYGTCEFCQTPIDDEVLARTPYASRCGSHLL